MTKQETINKVKRLYDKLGERKISEGSDFELWYDTDESGAKLTEKIVGLGMDGDELCALGEKLVFPLEELSKRELETLYSLVKK